MRNFVKESFFVEFLSFNKFNWFVIDLLVTLFRFVIMLIKRVFEVELWVIIGYLCKFIFYNFRASFYTLDIELFSLFEIRQFNLWTFFYRKFIFHIRLLLLLAFDNYLITLNNIWLFIVFQINYCSRENSHYTNWNHTNYDDYCGFIWLTIWCWFISVLKDWVGLTLISLKLSSFIYQHNTWSYWQYAS